MKKGFRYALFATAVLLLASCSATEICAGRFIFVGRGAHTDGQQGNQAFRPIDVCPPESECQMVQLDKDTVVCL